jgi:hypothetical protein
MSAVTAADSFQVFDTSEVGPELCRLHELVVRTTGRVEVAGDDGTSVLISKTELDSLERALAVLSQTDEVRELCDVVAQLAHQAASS